MFISPAPFVVRPMVAADLPAVADIDGRSLPTPARPGLYRYEISENELARYAVLAVVDKVAGFSGYWLMAGEAHISIIAVDPDWRGQGLGELLLLHLLFDAAEQAAQVATLEVRESNVVAQALYRKYHFVEVGKRRRYYRDTGEDALIMTGPPLDAAYGRFLHTRQRDLAVRLTTAAPPTAPG